MSVFCWAILPRKENVVREAMISRILSGIIVAGYLVFGIACGLGPGVLLIVGYLGFCVLCIWYSDEMGDMILYSQGVTKSSPGWAVAFGGWLLLLLPIICGIIMECRTP